MENTIQKITFPCMVCTRDTHNIHANKNGYRVWKCEYCKTLSVNPVPNQAEAAKVYSRDYFDGATEGHGYVDYDVDKRAMKSVFVDHIGHFEQLIGSSGKLFDVGAATGYFMRLARERGWDVYGIDVSDYASRIARKHGFEVATGSIESVIIQKDLMDVVTMWDVLEHVSNPMADLGKVHAMLKPGGLLAVNTPDSGSLFSRLMGKRWHLLVPPEHIWYFNRNSLKQLLGNSGFEVIEVACIGKRFTVEYVISFLYRWQKLSIWKSLLNWLEKGNIGKISVPINLRDNMYVLARKK